MGLPFRNITAWVYSIKMHRDLQSRLVQCDLPDFSQGIGTKDEEIKEFIGNQVKRVRQFVHEHPSLSLIEFSIEDPSAGEYLASVFSDDRVVAKYWGLHNHNKNITN